jgi:hypothetical protein
MIPVSHATEEKEYWREWRVKQSRVVIYADHERKKLRLIEHEQELNDRKMKALKEYDARLIDQIYKLKKERDQAELQKNMLSQLNIIG